MRTIHMPLTVYKAGFVIVERPGLSRFAVVPCIIQLEIPSGAKVTNGVEDVYFTNHDEQNLGKWTNVYVLKRRCSKAKVKNIWTIRNDRLYKCKTAIGHSYFCENFRYQIGETVRPANGFTESEDMCACGIHFFNTLREAKIYAFENTVDSLILTMNRQTLLVSLYKVDRALKERKVGEK